LSIGGCYRNAPSLTRSFAKAAHTLFRAGLWSFSPHSSSGLSATRRKVASGDANAGARGTISDNIGRNPAEASGRTRRFAATAIGVYVGLRLAALQAKVKADSSGLELSLVQALRGVEGRRA
jgi:hypothetical protein